MSVDPDPPEVQARTEIGTTRDGVDQFRRRWEVADDQRVAALLLVHGLGEHSGRYLHVGAGLARRGIDVLAFDNRGYGRSGGRRAYVERFSQFLDDIEDGLADRRTLGVPVVLMGHSLGGLMSVTYLVRSRPGPDLAVLSAPAVAADVPRWQRVAAPVLGRVAPRLFLPDGIDPDHLSRDAEVGAAFSDDPLAVHGATTRFGHQVLRTMKRTSARLDRIDVPTYVLHGADDRLVAAETSEPMAELPVVTRRLWPGLRHECLNEPEGAAVLAELADWIVDTASTVGSPAADRAHQRRGNGSPGH